ncbi:MAG TPA: hypothetical protein VHN58_02930 [Croceicoccus sp.]|nr:hypothetical protein [Croceicoccus sp.]
MRALFLLALATLMALPAPATAQDGAYPVAQVYAAFREACGTVPDWSGTVDHVAGAGWQRTDAAGVPTLAGFLDFAEKAGKDAVADEGGALSPVGVFTSIVAGEALAIVVTEVTIHGGRVTGCRLFDAGETRDAGKDAVVALIGQPPASELLREGNTIVKFDAPAQGIDSFDYYFIPAGSPLEEMVHFNGLAMKIDTIGPAASSTTSSSVAQAQSTEGK